MDEHIMERYLAEVPYEFREAVMSLSMIRIGRYILHLLKRVKKDSMK